MCAVLNYFWMRFPTFIKLASPKAFSYTPRYCGADKESSCAHNKQPTRHRQVHRMSLRRKRPLVPYKIGTIHLGFVGLVVCTLLFVGYLFYGGVVLWLGGGVTATLVICGYLRHMRKSAKHE